MAVLERGQVSAEDARTYAGQWVAIVDSCVKFGSVDAEEVIRWIEDNKLHVDLMTKLPRQDAPKYWML